MFEFIFHLISSTSQKIYYTFQLP